MYKKEDRTSHIKNHAFTNKYGENRFMDTVTKNEVSRKHNHLPGKKIYIGNLDYSVTKDQLKKLFLTYGEVTRVKVVKGKGFGFVDMSCRTEAEKAMKALSGTEFIGRIVKVNRARPFRKKDSKRNYFSPRSLETFQ